MSVIITEFLAPLFFSQTSLELHVIILRRKNVIKKQAPSKPHKHSTGPTLTQHKAREFATRSQLVMCVLLSLSAMF
jgi:hypothetical protein